MSVTSACMNAVLEGKKVIFFGAGIDAARIMYSLDNRQKLLVSYICDNDPKKHGSSMYGVPICHPDRLLNEDKNETVIIITSSWYNREIGKQLFNMGFFNIYSQDIERANIRISESYLMANTGDYYKEILQRRFEVLSRLNTNKVRELLADDLSVETFDKLLDAFKEGRYNLSHANAKETMYFNNIFQDSITGDEVYMDVGTRNISTIVDFILYTKGKYKKIYAFEPDVSLIGILIDQLTDVRDLEVLPYGLSDIDGEVAFDIKKQGCSQIINDVKHFEGVLTSAKVIKLDNFTKLPPTFIKMDIEGAEYGALAGGREVIQKYKPKLAISVYHKDDDLVTLPLLIHEMVPEYKLYLRHHTDLFSETVLYAQT